MDQLYSKQLIICIPYNFRYIIRPNMNTLFGLLFGPNKIRTRNKSIDYLESLQYRQDVRHIANYRKRKHFPSYTRCSENHNNTCEENRKIRDFIFDTLY